MSKSTDEKAKTKMEEGGQGKNVRRDQKRKGRKVKEESSGG